MSDSDSDGGGTPGVVRSTRRHRKRADRDERHMRLVREKFGAVNNTAATAHGGDRGSWGGAQRRMTDAILPPTRADEAMAAVPGRYVPVGFDRYVSPVINPLDYEFYRVAGWRVAVPRITPGLRVKDLVSRIFYYGPQSAGYVRVGDTLVPAMLGVGDRQTLAQASLESFPLTQ